MRLLVRYRSLLSNKNFALLSAGELISNVGSKVVYIAILAKVLEMTGSPINVGIVAVLGAVPTVMLAPLAGVIADKLPRRTIVVLTNLVRAIISLGFIFTSRLIEIYALTLTDAVIASFFVPARQALEPSLVRKDQLLEMNSFNTVTRNFVQVAGPAIAGAVVAAAGYNAAFIVNSISFLVAGVAAAMLVLPALSGNSGNHDHVAGADDHVSSVNRRLAGVYGPPFRHVWPHIAHKTWARMWDHFRAGWSYFTSSSLLSYIFALQLAITLAISMQGTLLFVYADRYLGAPGHVAQKAGLLYSTVGIGGLLGGLVLGYVVKWIRRIPLLLILLALDGLAVVFLALNTNFLVALVICTLLGLMSVAFSVTANTMVQEEVPEDLRGRVFALLGSVIGPVSLLSIGIGAGLAGVFGPRAVFMGAGIIEIGLAVFGRCIPSYGLVRSR